MIHDASIEVSCDGEGCWEAIQLPLPAGTCNTYLANDSQIERNLVREDWIVRDGRHFCSEICAEEK